MKLLFYSKQLVNLIVFNFVGLNFFLRGNLCCFQATALATLDKGVCEKWSRYLALKSHFYKAQVCRLKGKVIFECPEQKFYSFKYKNVKIIY